METTTRIKGLLLSAALCLTGVVTAQETMTTTTTTTNVAEKPSYDQGFRLGFGVSGGYLLEKDAFDGLGLGADVRLQYDFSKRISITLTTGYNYMFINNDLDDIGFCDIEQIPVKAGFKAFFWEDQFYALGEAGAGFTVSKNSPFAEDTTLILSPGIGWANKYLDLSVRYEHYTEFETGQVALRLAYGFRL